MQIGTIKEIWRYPVKSLGGEQVNATHIQAKGIADDRCWSVRDDVTGELVGGRKIPGLMMLSARYIDQPHTSFGKPVQAVVEITFPNGQIIRSDDPYASAILSMYLGRRVSLISRPTPKEKAAYKLAKPMTPAEVRYALGMKPEDPDPDFSSFSLGMLTTLSMYATPPGVLYDVYPLHLLTTSALQWIGQFYPEGDFCTRRYRPSFLIETEASAHGIVENDWRGRELQIGDLRIKCNHPTIRCSMPGAAQPGLPKDPNIPITLMKHAGQHLGAYATPVNEARIQVGDTVELLPEHQSKVYSWLDTVGRRTKAQILKANTAMGNLLDKKPKAKPASALPAGFMPLRVIGKQMESADVVSLTLAASNAGKLPRFLPGQHLVLAIPQANGKLTYRPYSLSSGSHGLDEYRISVKLKTLDNGEPGEGRGPSTTTANRMGEASGFLHREVNVGTQLYAKGPHGQFAIYPKEDSPLVLISSGIGITPFISILHTLAEENISRSVTLIHGTRTMSNLPFQHELAQLKERLPNLQVQLWVSQPDKVDDELKQGRINLAEALGPAEEHANSTFMVCGTPSFSDDMRGVLIRVGVNPNQVLTESLGASLIGAKGHTESRQITFSQSGQTLVWHGQTDSLLSLAESQGIEVSAGCRYGACQACEATLMAGDVAYPEGVQPPAGKNRILLCSARPMTDLEIAL